MCDKKSADCCQQSAGVAGDSLCLGGSTMPTAIIPQGDGDFKSLSSPFLTGAGAVPGGVARRVRQAGPASLSDGSLLVDNRRSSPPCGNTGVQSACVVDWLHGTFLDPDTSIDQALDYVRFLFGEIVPLDRGFRGYANSGVILGTGRVAWDYDRPDMGVHVDLPGSALGELRRSITDFEGMLRFMVDVGFVFTRCDSAVDDRDGVLDVATIRKAVESGDYASRWHKASRTYNLRGAGDTIYLGAPTSDSRLRIYDKAAEQGLEGVHWVRVELQFRRGLAHAMVLRLVEDGPDVVLSVLRGCVDFKEPGGDSNVARRRSASWWVRFLRAREKLRLVLPRVAQTLEGVRRWIEHQVAPSLALLVKAEGGALDWLISVIHEGERRLTPQRLALLPVDV